MLVLISYGIFWMSSLPFLCTASFYHISSFLSWFMKDPFSVPNWFYLTEWSFIGHDSFDGYKRYHQNWGKCQDPAQHLGKGRIGVFWFVVEYDFQRSHITHCHLYYNFPICVCLFGYYLLLHISSDFKTKHIFGDPMALVRF